MNCRVEPNMEVQQDGLQDQEGLGDQVTDSLGMSNAEDHENEPQAERQENTNDPLFVQKRLKQQRRAHEREIRELHARISDLQSRVSPEPSAPDLANPYAVNGVDEHIHKAVSFALQQKDLEERKAREAQQQAHVAKQYQALNKHLDTMADKYDDFDDVVRGESTPFTSHMRDIAMTLPQNGPGSAGEVLYKLGKNPQELERISQLHPLDQARELVKLSHALIGGADKLAPQAKPLGSIKSNPATNTHGVTDKTPIGDLRRRMKAGWK